MNAMIRLTQLLLRLYFKATLSPVDYAKRQGVRIGQNCLINHKVNFGSEPYLVSIGDNFYSSICVQFITHDGSVNVFRNLYKDCQDIDYFAPIRIGNNVFLGYGVTVMPGSIIQDNVIVGAASLVKGKLKSDSVYAGTPARYICSIDEYFQKNKGEFLATKKMPPKEKIAAIKAHFNVS